MSPPSVVHLWRYAVKGLERDAPSSVTLELGAGFPADRRWALIFEEGWVLKGGERAQSFDPAGGRSETRPPSRPPPRQAPAAAPGLVSEGWAF